MLKLRKYLTPFRVPLIISMVLLALKSLSDLYLPRLTADMVNTGLVNNDIPYILRVGGIMLAVAAFNIACLLIAVYVAAKAGNAFCRDLRDQVFTRIESFSLSEFDRFGTASLITRTTNDINQIRGIMDFGLRMIVMSPVMIIGSVVMAFTKDPALALIFVVIIPIISAAFFFVLHKGLPLNTQLQKKLDGINLVLREGLTGIRVIRAFNKEGTDKRRFETINKEYADSFIYVNRLMGIITPLVTLIMNLAILAIVWFGGFRITAGEIQVGDLMAFIQYALLVISALTTFTRLLIMIPRASVSAGRINEVLETVPAVSDPEAAKASGGLSGVVEFQDVTFSYPGAECPAVHRISFTARPGETTAIIGGTGSGKSTLAQLILRIYDVTDGAVLVDGVDTRDMPQEALRAKIGYVPQKTVLFSGSVRENILYGKEDASLEEIAHAADVAQAGDFIRSMEGGFNAEISQGGLNLSGGQKQRLAIARALIRRPEIYIFDDSFSALDFTTDAMLRRALRKETGQATVLIISQRVSTVMDADQIVVLENSEIVGIGTHDALLASSAVYREIVSSQLSEEVSA